ncbi:flagellar biosynthesis protein FlgH [Duganella sp. Leaf126]|uniref:flagellar basal body L-ring protein FlgH n=1 Tax=Duganella sp. Leaf126 TaxID=1736266 RepID=UPI0006F66079|nr:flagellar basal body L-ring protein FlgH [Duganella sp. Leaf126]KQQ33440.1 flagellar biosynthesis protein FlgH [Duganella sp. Leaf126]
MKSASLVLLTVAVAAAGCANVTPTSIVDTPRTARPLTTEQMQVKPTSGAIYQGGNFRPIFEDRRARQVGDVLTLVITERTTANKAGTNSANKASAVSIGLPKPLQGTFGNPLAINNNNSFSGADNQTASNAFTGTMGVTVVEVLPNGNLIVAGEKQVAMNKGVEFIRFSGMVNPDNIATGNTVSSTAVADARVEYRTSSQVDKAEVASMMSRFFQSILPF